MKTITPHRAAKLLGVHKETVYRWCHCAVEGLPSRLTNVTREVNGRYLIAKADVESLLDTRRSSVTP